MPYDYTTQAMVKFTEWNRLCSGCGRDWSSLGLVEKWRRHGPFTSMSCVISSYHPEGI